MSLSTPAFRSIIQSLNPKQRKAVETIDGPVLVIAGPGTGKTHILSARIGNILINTDAEPKNILCLTYTEAGVQAMRERLVEFIGPTGNQVYIHTFHSFCNSVIKMHPSAFGSYDLQPIDDLEKHTLIKSLLDDVPLDSPLLKGMRTQYSNENQVRSLFDFMKMENLTERIMVDGIKAYLDDLPSRPEYQYKRKYKEFAAGDPKQAMIDKEIERMEKLQAAVELYPKYVEAMVNMDRYDYADMILWVIKAFEKDEALLSIYQEQFQYVLVDEFQDTSGAQMRILDLLINYWDSPNVFAVGDDDQCVYEFQGARIGNIADFLRRYDDMSLILLEDNYRSTQQILDACSVSIDHNHHRLINIARAQFGEDKKLHAALPERQKIQVDPIIKSYPTHLYELSDLVNQIERLIKDGARPGEIAVLYAKHSQSEDLMTLLRARDIAYNTKRRVNVLREPIIQNVRLLIDFAAQQIEDFNVDDYQLFKLLHLPFFDIDPVDLAKIGFYMSDPNLEEKVSWRTSISDAELLEKLKIQNPTSILTLSKKLSNWSKAIHEKSLQGYIEHIITDAGVLAYILRHDDKNYLIQLLTTFYNSTKEEIKKNPDLTLGQLLNIYNRMDEAKVDLPYNKSIYTDDGVQLLTAHGSKGLEFQYVFLLEVTKEKWQSTRGGSFQFKYPDTVTRTADSDATESKRRLFYVAMSRAKEYLQISYPEYKNDEKALQRAEFLDELKNAQITYETPIVSDADIMTNQLELLASSAKAKINLPLESIIQERLKEFRMSPSALNAYIRCPISFYYNNILRVPSTQSEAATYGMTMHYALERLFVDMLDKGDGSFITKNALIKIFEDRMYTMRGNFSASGLKFATAKGSKNLGMLYDQKVDIWNRKVEPEKFIKDVAVVGVPLKGTIDKVEHLENQEVRLVDYKSGKFKKENVSPPSARLPEGGPYWRQLVFYKFLFEGSAESKGMKAKSTMVAYIDADKDDVFAEHEVSFIPEHEELVLTIIKDTYAKIMNQDFNTGCEDEYCEWCNFVKNTGQDISQFTAVDEDEVRDEA